MDCKVDPLDQLIPLAVFEFNVTDWPAQILLEPAAEITGAAGIPPSWIAIEELKIISPLQFFSYTEYDGKIYGFNILSIFNLINKEKNKQPINPYTRNIIVDKVVNESTPEPLVTSACPLAPSAEGKVKVKFDAIESGAFIAT